MSSRRTPLVSGYKKYTFSSELAKEKNKNKANAGWFAVVGEGVPTENETASAEKCMN
jgi:hypothetical protein